MTTFDVSPTTDRSEQVRAHGARVLRRFGPPPRPWVAPTSTDHDVLVVGGGQAGIGIAFALRRAGIADVSVIDASAPGESGVWRTTARMPTLRTPKAWPEPEYGQPELSFRAWFEETHGTEAYAALGAIPREAWASYVDWFHSVVDVPVRHRTRLVDLRPATAETPAVTAVLEVVRADGTRDLRTETTRKVVLANGVEGTGGPYLPEPFAGLPREVAAHTGHPIDFASLRSRRVAVLGAAASALDAAGAALAAGAAEVHLFTRRPHLLVQGPAGFGPADVGARDNYRHRSDADRWQRKVAAARKGRSCTLASVERAVAHPGFHLHLDAGWRAARHDGTEVVVEAVDGTHRFDFVIAGTGYQYDPHTRAELRTLAPLVARWADRYAPPAALRDDLLARTPYLGADFEFVPTSEGPADAWVERVHVFSAAAGLSFGYPIGDVQSLAPEIPRLVAALSRDLFLDDEAARRGAAVSTGADSPLPAAEPDPHREIYAGAVWAPGIAASSSRV